MRVDTLVALLGERRAAVAHDALASPGGSLFDYGRAVGFYAGLTEAEEIIKGLLEEDASRKL